MRKTYILTATKDEKTEKFTYREYWQALTASLQLMNLGWTTSITEEIQRKRNRKVPFPLLKIIPHENSICQEENYKKIYKITILKLCKNK